MLRTPSRLAALAVGSLLAGGLTACGGDEPSPRADGRTAVIAGFYPLQFIAEKVGGDRVAVTNLTKPGAEPHDLELAADQVAALKGAGLVVYLAGFQPAVDEAVEQQAKNRAFDVAAVQPLNDAPAGVEEHEEEGGEEESHANEGKDPHVWLDPLRFAAIVDKLAERLAAVDGPHAADLKARAAALRTELEKLDREFTTGLANCKRREIFTSHAAFGYLTAKYKLEQIPINGLSPEGEPSPQRVIEVTKLAKDKGATTIFFETLVSPKLSETLAKEVGAKADVLDPIEGIKDGGGDYLSVMRDNLKRLRTALDCT